MSLIREIMDIRRFFKLTKTNSDITFYSESGIYYQNFRGTIKEILTGSDLYIYYITSDIRDPIFDFKHERLASFYINKLISFFFPFINTKTLIMTMADLDQYHIKRSINKVNHIYMFHAINSVHMQYNQKAFDSYDTIFCVGPHHISEIRETEKLYNLPQKKLVEVGYSLLEDIEKKYDDSLIVKNKILIAPSWNSGNILESCIEKILDKLIPSGYEVVVRPHPEFLRRRKDKVIELQKQYANYGNIKIKTELTNSKSILESAVLITDWSGIAIEFLWGMLKPVIYINTEKKIHNSEYKKINLEPIEDSIRFSSGITLEISELAKIEEKINMSFEEINRIREKLIFDRQKNIFNWGKSSKTGSDYIIDYCNLN